MEFLLDKDITMHLNSAEDKCIIKFMVNKNAKFHNTETHNATHTKKHQSSNYCIVIVNTLREFSNGKQLQSFWPTTTKWMSSTQQYNKSTAKGVV